MEDSYLKRQALLLLNQLLIITYLGYENLCWQELKSPVIFPLILTSLVIGDAIYIGCMNLKCGRTLSIYTFILILITWYVLWALDGNNAFLTLLAMDGAIILYASTRFVLSFFFQDSAYTYQKQIKIMLLVLCLFALVAKLINSRLFSLVYLIQFIMSATLCLFLFIIHRKRIFFVMKSEWIHLLISSLLVIFVFIGYLICFRKYQEYIAGSGIYLMLFLPLFSIHSIAFSNRKGTPFTFLLGSKQITILLVSLTSLFTAVCIFLKLTVIEIFIIIHCILWFFLLYNILLYSYIKKSKLLNSKSISPLQDSYYTQALTQIEKEENLKKDFSNYLHDEVLQDLLSIKNMLNKSDRPEIRNIILQTLDNLNSSIRKQSRNTIQLY